MKNPMLMISIALGIMICAEITVAIVPCVYSSEKTAKAENIINTEVM